LGFLWIGGTNHCFKLRHAIRTWSVRVVVWILHNQVHASEWVFIYTNLYWVCFFSQISGAVEADSGDYECQVTGGPSEEPEVAEVAEDGEDTGVLNQKLEINVFDKRKYTRSKNKKKRQPMEEGTKREAISSTASEAELALASLVQNDQEKSREEAQIVKERRKSRTGEVRFSAASRPLWSTVNAFALLFLAGISI
jgi:hypothetical protein